jgi:hypothetical protein
MAQATRAVILLAALVLTAVAPAHAAGVPPPAKTAPVIHPAWNELSAQQRTALAPLADDWEQFEAARRKKWVAIADRYPKMTTAEQERLQARMKAWANLSKAERQAARERYKLVKQLPPDERRQMQARWEEYQRTLAAQRATEEAVPAGGQAQ